MELGGRPAHACEAMGWARWGQRSRTRRAADDREPARSRGYPTGEGSTGTVPATDGATRCCRGRRGRHQRQAHRASRPCEGGLERVLEDEDEEAAEEEEARLGAGDGVSRVGGDSGVAGLCDERDRELSSSATEGKRARADLGPPLRCCSRSNSSTASEPGWFASLAAARMPASLDSDCVHEVLEVGRETCGSDAEAGGFRSLSAPGGGRSQARLSVRLTTVRRSGRWFFALTWLLDVRR